MMPMAAAPALTKASKAAGAALAANGFALKSKTAWTLLGSKMTPALLAKAFRGELVPQDPNDEPATELLRRLREARAAEARIKPKRGRKAAAT